MEGKAECVGKAGDPSGVGEALAFLAYDTKIHSPNSNDGGS